MGFLWYYNILCIIILFSQVSLGKKKRKEKSLASRFKKCSLDMIRASNLRLEGWKVEWMETGMSDSQHFMQIRMRKSQI